MARYFRVASGNSGRMFDRNGGFMKDQNKFLETLEEIKTIAAAQQNKMTKDEIIRYLSDMELEESKLEAVYHYLAAAGVSVEGYRFVPDKIDKKVMAGREDSDTDNAKEEEKESSDAEKTATRAENNRRMYKNEVERIVVSDAAVREDIDNFIRGDNGAKDRIIESKLSYVMELASKYKKREVVVNDTITIDDIISEGNVGLLIGLSVVQDNRNIYIKPDGTPDYQAFEGTLETEIVNAIESMIDDMSNDKDWEDAVLAKTNLLHEAAKYMTEELGRVPSVQELSDYTKISKEEISNIMGLSEDAKRVADE